VIIQEGVPTYEAINDAIAEPVVYMIDRYVVGGFYRVHASRGRDENLNAPGAEFVPLAFESPCIPDLGAPVGCPPNRFYAYGVVARLAQLAAAVEVEQLAERDVPEYVEVDHNKLTATYVRVPALSDVPYPVQMEPNLVVEFYSR